jgi:hypothetical protein
VATSVGSGHRRGRVSCGSDDRAYALPDPGHCGGDSPVAAKSAAPKPLAPREGWLVIPRIGLAAPVGSYDNCHQDAKHPTWDVPEGVTRWSCIQAGVWLLGHKPGIFTNLPLVQTGDRFYYGLQAYSVTGREEVAYGATVTVAPMTLQTCLRPDATVLLLVRAAPVP